MSALKYTDRDVRENEREFTQLVYDYLMDYQGEFQFLVDCKMRVVSEYDLTIGMIRGVLNCMRVDPRAPSLPLPPQEFDADVIPMRESHRPARNYKHKKYCENDEPHVHEQSEFAYLHYCSGVYKVNRNTAYRRPAEIHSEFIFVVGKSPSTITCHRAVSAEIEWYPVIHDWGWQKESDLIIHTNCKHPYYLRNGLLLTIEMVNEYSTEYGLERCPRCFSDDA